MKKVVILLMVSIFLFSPELSLANSDVQDSSQTVKKHSLMLDIAPQMYSGNTTEMLHGMPGIVKTKSQLDYPVPLAGGEIDLGIKNRYNNPKKFALFLGTQYSFIDPVAEMRDRDWISFEYFNLYNAPFSDTKSKSTGWNYKIYSEIRTEVIRTEPLKFGAGIGYDYLKYSYNIWGLEGTQWAYDTLGNMVAETTFSVSEDTLALEYDLTMKGFYVLGWAGYKVHDILYCQLVMKFSPLFSVRAVDHHVLRKFKITETGVNGLYLSANIDVEPSLDFSVWKTRWIPFIDIRYEKADFPDVESDQNFYGDDPGSSNDETGLEIKNIPSSIKFDVWTINIGLRLK